MKQVIVIILLAAMISKLNTCSINIAGGATSETTNGTISARILHEDGTPAANTPVFLVPVSFNPVTDNTSSGCLKDTTDEQGRCTIIVTKTGRYNLLATDPVTLTRSLYPAIEIQKETIVLSDTLRIPGAARIELPDSVDTIAGYLYIPGTNRYQKLAEETLLHVGNKIQVVFDSIPAAAMPGIYFGTSDSLFYSIPLTNIFRVFSGDTVNLFVQVEWLAYSTANSGLPSNNVMAVMADKSGTLWAGTFSSGLATFDGTNWFVYTTQNSQLPSNSVEALAQASDGTIWVGTTGGAVRITGTGWQVYTMSTSGIPKNYITAVAVDSIGNTWFGTFNGCVEFDGIIWKQHTNPLGSSMGAVNAITVDKQGLVMVGTDDGLFIYNKKEWKKIAVSASSFQYNSITDIAVDLNNVIWLATESGLASYSSGACTIYENIGLTFFTSKLQSIAIDWNNTVWAGTFYEGTVVKGSNPVVVYNGNNTGVLKGAVRINDIDACTKNTICFGTDYNGIILVKFTLGI